MSNALVVMPTYFTQPEDVAVTLDAIRSVRETQGALVDILLVDDGSPERDLVADVERHSSELKFDLHAKDENTGFAKTVNVGMRKALDEGRHCILLNADIEIVTPNWLGHMLATTDQRGQQAGVVGALLLFPEGGLIQHAGIYFSMLTRSFDHRFKFGPANLPEALRKEVCPVTGAFQFVRHSIIEKVGLYDEQFYMGWEDVDYCIRVFMAGEQCVYNPNIRAYHAESMFRGRPSPKVAEWQQKSYIYLMLKYQHQSFAEFVPAM